jgi:hypothetical protein
VLSPAYQDMVNLTVSPDQGIIKNIYDCSDGGNILLLTVTFLDVTAVLLQHYHH